MESEYDQKFEEMKKYIPFLENMIKRLESTSSQASAHPRQAQLDKIRSLRVLLLNKKKRMKMENLLKCEQVLINLYAKVEQRDTLSGVKKGPDGFSIDPPTAQEKSDLEAVRNKLKNVAKRQDEVQETLPEILRVDEVQEMHTAGSKEPALFQRRPNKSSLSPTHVSPTKIKVERVSPSASKRNYTRVLVSPDSSGRRWSESVDNKPLFSRRSPRRSPRRYSPSYHKKERKKPLKESTAPKSKDLNITLKVPEDSLSTLNTKDIFTRIINCKDGDVDIDTLRELRKQILTELKKTGARDDISDLILKSYNKKKRNRSKKEEVEEGELSDSESEVIENVYGSLSGNLVLKDQSEANTSTDNDKARKIQICLVINSDKNNSDSKTNTKVEITNNSDVAELEMYEKESKEVNKNNCNEKKNEPDVIKLDDEDVSVTTTPEVKNKEHNSTVKETSKNDTADETLPQLPEEEYKVITPKQSVKYTANFYKPTDTSETEEPNKDCKEDTQAQVETRKESDIKTDTKTETNVSEEPSTKRDVCAIEAELEQMEKPVEIPLLNEPTIPEKPTNSTLSEIDILQALKNEILSETITIPGSEAGTPLLHQPKVNKVASAKEILPKKRISIENYKQKIVSSTRFYFDDNDSKDDLVKKPSLKLTEKECERFNIQKKLSFDDDSSDGDDESEIQASDLYSDLAPKSPDHEESSNLESTPPVIIPGDPVKTLPVNRNADIDMRTLPILSPNQNKAPSLFSSVTGFTSNNTITTTKTDTKTEQVKSQNRPVLLDPRVKRDINSSLSPSPHTVNPDRTPRSAYSNIIKSPAPNAAMTPNARSYEMTPNHQSFEIDQSNKKHVYMPSFGMIDCKERENSVAKDSKIESSGERKSRFDDIGDTSSWSSSDVSMNTRYTDSFSTDKYSKGQRKDRYSLDNRDNFTYKRSEGPKTPNLPFGRSEAPVTSTQTFNKLDKAMTPMHSFGGAECPTTPSHYFGRSECPPTPSHSFGRSDCPLTPSHPFGRSECPSTPSHPFGRSECPPTPSHPFGRIECPATPSHPFGRSDCPSTPSHPFGSHSFNNYDRPLTPSHHQYGASDCPPTPYYGRNECPPTPNHGFGRSDCPSTPSHPFGRSDFNAHKYNKDPRINRKPEYESNSQLNERDRGYYKERGYYQGSTYKSQKTFGGSDPYINQDRELEKNSKYRYYAPDQTGRHMSRDHSRREQTIGGSRTNDYENDRTYSRERGPYNSDNSGYDDVALRRGQQRERSVGRSIYPEDKRERSVGRHVVTEDTFSTTIPRSSSRGPSIRRNSSIEPEKKSLSVKSHGGRSFTIDTSVNATFQKFLESKTGSHAFESNFDSRRQRATSVGRSLARASRWEPVSDDCKQNSKIISKRDMFRRASSVGRDLADYSADKRSFQEIKADFKTYRHPVKESSKSEKIRSIDTNTKNNYEGKAFRRDSYDKYKEEARSQSSPRQSYSPRKNSRDPRMRKENNINNKYEDPRSRKSGIVYSNDNIVKGAILSSGYGVKNYKIPKIKRAVEEKEVEIPKKDESVNKKDVREKDKRIDMDKKREDETVQDKAKDKIKDNKNKETPKQNIKDSQIEKKGEISKQKNKEATIGKINDSIKETDTKSDSETEKDTIAIDAPDEQIGRRSTRLSKKLAGTNTGKEPVAKTKKSKKSIISDSDSETDNSATEKLPKANEPNLNVIKPTPSPQVTASPVKEKNISKQSNAVDIQTNFGLELELFSDNVASDPVLENINALIADLDNDLDSSKNESSNNFTNEITLENMLQNITSPRDNSIESTDEFTKVLEDVAELSKTTQNKEVNSLSDLKENKIKSVVADVHTDVFQELKNTEDSSMNKCASQSFDDILATVKSSESISAQNEVSNKKDEALNSSLPLNKPTNDDIVSTTEIEKDTMLVEDKTKIDERSMDGCSTPDSTINTDVLDKNKTEDCVADSTNEEGHSETNVSSTDSVEPKPNPSSKETASDLELGNLLTVLQDKSKIKKLLSMLGDQTGDNDRIRKKLEKLSEIVSEDEMDEKSEQPEKSKTEVSVPTDDKISEAVQRVDENKNDETESESKDIDQTTLNLNDKESELTKVDEQENDDQEKEESFEDFAGDDSFEPEEAELQVTKTKYKKKIPGKKTKFPKKGKGRCAKKVTSIAEKRVTRATAAVGVKNKPKKPPRELQQLHEDIREMFIRDDILSATGIRMCRLAKMVDEKPAAKNEVLLPETEPVVVLEKFKNTIDKSRDNPIPEKVRKKPGPKPKPKISTDSMPVMEKPKYKPGPKSKTKAKKEIDPYAFEVDSVGDTITEKASDDESDHSSDSEVCSLASSKSFGSSEVLAEIKKKNKRKRGRGWQDGVIKPKYNKKKKVETKLDSSLETPDRKKSTEKQTAVRDMQCFTDRNYCFRKNEFVHSCRLCAYTGTDIVHHYVNEHPHVEIPLSRMDPVLAKEAIEQCKEINFKAVSKISSEKYVCIFCYQEFPNNSSVLETFFWHVVSMHTGEYKHTCGECSNESRCPFSLDIPPPPKETKGQLIGFICKKCHFTQLSLENLKNHVIRRHNDEQTAVYTINLSAMSKETLKEFLRLREQPTAANGSPLEIRARLSEEPNNDAEINARVSESEEAQQTPAKNTGPIAGIKSKITFEADDNVGELSDLTSESHSEPIIKIERVESETIEEMSQEEVSTDTNEINQPKQLDLHRVQPGPQEEQLNLTAVLEDPSSVPSNDIVDYPHFKINFTESGTKEYICCINGKDNHFKTTLLISMKKHVQLKHSENWDGYCFICKVIVTPQGAHKYKECFQHYLDKHMDNFPIYQKEVLPKPAEKVPDKENRQTDSPAPSKPLINVRPINELMTPAPKDSTKETPSFPVIQSVVSLGAESPQINPTYPVVRRDVKPTESFFKYEEVQAKVMSNKHRVVLENMMVKDKLIKVFKCAGRFCSFSSDSAEEALLHASTHQRIGGVDSLNCSYCDFDAMANAIDLVMHVFKEHGNCQYSCQQCFYRAASSQAVAAHAYRLHGITLAEVNVLRTTVATNAPHEGEVLTRDEAVQSYVCQLLENGSVCKFHSYTPDKFCEHVLQKHPGATTHSCYVCHKETSSTKELIDHMKLHGMKLYQCAWCVLGADSQDELLAHVSVAHPTKQPQAYLRIVTNKGRHDLRVLPLAFLNKVEVPTEDVTPSAIKENPVREAERSIDLEKLISLTMTIEPQLEPEAASEHAEVPEEDTLEAVEPSVPPIATVVPVIPVPELQAEVFTPVSNIVLVAGPSQTNVSDNNPLLQTPAVTAAVDPSLTISKVAIKTEVTETPAAEPSDVVVLDSDDEDIRQPVIDLSTEDTSTSTKTNSTSQKVPIEILSTCPKCQQICKSINGLKKHFYYCYPNKNEGSKCAHCPYLASSRDNIMHHYMHDHSDRNVYQCGVCRVTLLTMALVKQHLKYVHKEKDLVVTSTVENGITSYVVNVAKKDKKEVPKRKLSGNATETLTKRRFSPQEINLLPINPILDHLVYCEICEFSTKVRLNMVRHLQLHAEQQPVAQTAPVNPVPHLETNEKHFDKMVNLASSSLGARPERAAERPCAVRVSPDVAARFPQLVPARRRHTCGAPGCAYTSVDEPTLRRHWDALHAAPGANAFRCVHCPTNQTTDSSKPITATRVLQHLKMHDDSLYACSTCYIYHYRREFMEKHIMENHPSALLYIVRESPEVAAAAAAPAVSSSAAPTMDLKPWQCGLCKFKSMLRPEVVEHCFKVHQSKMQFRCGYCPYRASVLENVNNHLAHSHANEPEDVIYYYYREGSLPDGPDGKPRWVLQRQKAGASLAVKTEEQADEPAAPAPDVDLNLVKKEVDDAAAAQEQSMDDLCRKFGQFCEPNGIMYKCPLCSVITEDTREAMQSHLYEELQYRKWGCGLCNYKAFHKAGLTEHMSSEHFRQYDHIELPIDVNKEKWVTGQLDHQAAIINKHKANLAKQKIVVERVNKPVTVVPPSTVEVVEKYSVSQLEEAFGGFGAPSGEMYCCPKCSALHKDEPAMRDHLETELNKIRWGCTNCSEKYQTYHEARFHCKGHDGPSRPKEAIRDPAMRAAWVSNIIQAQKKILQSASVTPATSEPCTSDTFTENDNNSLLVVRYEERIPTPDQLTASRKRPAPESDDERLVIDEGGPKKKTMRSCPQCSYKCKYYNPWKEHVLKHHNLKPYTCCYCDFSCSYRQGIIGHTEKCHPGRPMQMKMTAIPPAVSYILSTKKKPSTEEETNVPKLICLFCENSVPETDVDNHLHENIRPDFAKKGDVVVKCCICLVLRLDVKSLQEHHNLAHPHVQVNYAWFKLHHDTRETHVCGYCDDLAFKFIRDLKSHHNAVHPNLLFKYTTVPYVPALDDYKDSKKKKESPPQKRCARKSTTKLPSVKTVAKKSTTKLPYCVPNSSDDGYSYYKTKPDPLDKYANVTTLMSFCNRMMPFTLKKLSQIINIEPKVIVNDIRAGTSSDLTFM